MPFEFIVGAAVGVAAGSKRIRQTVRKGLIYGVGGVLVTFDKLAAMGHAARRSVHEATAPPGQPNTATPVNPAPQPQAAPQETSGHVASPAGTPS
jgi:hypothetical protein